MSLQFVDPDVSRSVDLIRPKKRQRVTAALEHEADREIVVRAAVKQKGNSLMTATPEQKADREIGARAAGKQE